MAWAAAARARSWDASCVSRPRRSCRNPCWLRADSDPLALSWPGFGFASRGIAPSCSAGRMSLRGCAWLAVVSPSTVALLCAMVRDACSRIALSLAGTADAPRCACRAMCASALARHAATCARNSPLCCSSIDFVRSAAMRDTATPGVGSPCSSVCAARAKAGSLWEGRAAHHQALDDVTPSPSGSLPHKLFSSTYRCHLLSRLSTQASNHTVQDPWGEWGLTRVAFRFTSCRQHPPDPA